MVPRRVSPVAGAALLFGLVLGVLFAPVLAGRATFVHGDALSVSLPLQHLLAESLARGELPLWSDEIYGGHPIFAEGQGGFAHPVNWLLFGLLPRLDAAGPDVGAGTLYAHGLLHVLCLWIAAIGTFGLGRALGLGAPAAALAGLALAASQDWLSLTANSAIALSVAFAPAVLLAQERWWQRPDATRACGLAAALAAVLLAGYPQALHALALFALVSLALRVDRAFLAAPWRHVATGALALALAFGLSAVQVLPTLELVGQSVRAQGVELVHGGDVVQQLRGLLFSIGPRESVEPGLGSALVLGLALVALARRRVIVAYAVASLLLFQLQLADASPVYRALHHTLPGLDLFRITHLYGTVGLVGVSVLAGFGAERLARLEGPARRALLGVAVVAAALAASAWAVQDAEVRRVGHLFPLAGAALAFAGVVRGRSRWLPAALVALLVAEIFAMRLPLHRFVPASVASEPPPTVRFLLERHPDARDFKVANVPHFFSHLGFASPSTVGLERLARQTLSSLAAGSNLLWGLPSLNANLALPLARRIAVGDRIEADARGESSRAAGARLIDALAVRYLVAHNQQRRAPHSPELQEVFYDEEFRFFVRENPVARSRLRLVPAAAVRWAPDREAALALFGGRGGEVVIEGEPPAAGGAPARAPAASLPGVAIAEARADRYRVDVDSREPAYLVLAAAPSPGWRARVEGEPVAVQPANVLGKAVAVPAGAHRVEIAFEPRSFAVGAWISLASLLAVAGLLWGAGRRAARTVAALASAGSPG